MENTCARSSMHALVGKELLPAREDVIVLGGAFLFVFFLIYQFIVTCMMHLWCVWATATYEVWNWELCTYSIGAPEIGKNKTTPDIHFVIFFLNHSFGFDLFGFFLLILHLISLIQREDTHNTYMRYMKKVVYIHTCI